jgi:tRNA pseudouridine38-40 synthase
MQNILIRISYDGTDYSGFQVQANAPTVQGEIERALAVIYKQPVRLIGAGRTDAGVHAREMTANFFAPFKIDHDKLPHALNCLLPTAIVITGAVDVAADFHARFDTSGKIYSYTIDRSVFLQVHKRLYSWHVPEPLDLAALSAAAKLFEGVHDFAAYRAAGSSVIDTTRTLYRVQPVWLSDEKLLIITFEGSGFLYRMVRLITGTLIRAGKKELDLDQIRAAIAGENKAAVGPTAPACGLCLEKVVYNQLKLFQQ